MATDDSTHEAARALCDAWRDSGESYRVGISRDGTLMIYRPSGTTARLTEPQLRVVLDENARMREELERRHSAIFTSGWYAAIDAYRTPGSDAREAAWQKYRQDLIEGEAPWHATPPQPEPDTTVSGRAELITWCRILGTGPACAKPCDDCRRTSAINAKLPDDFRVTMAAVRSERDAEAADATAAAHSATQTDAERAQAHRDGSHSSATPQEPQESTG